MNRPGLYPLHDILGINFIAPEDSNFLLGGYPPGLPVPSADHNGKLQRSGDWHRYMDVQSVHNDDWLDISPMSAATLTGALTYAAGGSVLAGGALVNSRGTYLIEGSRIETDAPFLNPLGGSVTGDPLLFPGATAPGRIWIYVDSNRNLRFDSVAPAAADSPAADEITLVGVDIDALGVVVDGGVAPTTLPLPLRRLPVVIPVRMSELSVIGSATVFAVTGGGVTGGSTAARINGGIGPALRVLSESPTDPALRASNADGGDALRVDGPAQCEDTLTVEGLATFNNRQIFNEGAVPIANFTGAGGAVFTADVLAEGDLTVEDALFAEGNTTLGTTAADTLTVNATASFIEPVQVESVVFEPDIFPAAARTLSAGPEYLVYRFGADPGTARILHQSTSGWIYRAARLEDETALFSNNTSLTTGSTFPVGLGSTVLVIAEGWAQQTSAGTATLALQMDDGVATFSTIGSTRAVFVKDTSVATDWTYFRLEREVNPGGIARRYRLSFSTGLGSLKIRESSLRIVSRN